MNRVMLGDTTKSLLRDFTSTTFRKSDIEKYINEGIERCQQVIDELAGMQLLTSDTTLVTHLPKQYAHLLSLYSASRCFFQDERHYQASNLMNEFEVKLQELKMKIESGKVVIVDPETGEPIISPFIEDYVVDNYFDKRRPLYK